MPNIEKISISLDSDVLAWLRQRAERKGMSLSAVLNEAAVMLRQAAARLAVSQTLGLQVSEDELVKARAELTVRKPVKPTRKARTVERRRKQA
jgi:hypothetical protein